MKLMPIIFGIIYLNFLLLPTTGFSQSIKSYSLGYNEAVDNLNIHLRTSSGNCTVRPSLSSNFVNIYSKTAEIEKSSSFHSYMEAGNQYITLQLNENQHLSLSKTLSQKVFYKNTVETDPAWNVYLTPYKKMDLNFHYNLGTADIDLSGLAVSSLKLNTGSADVKVGYSEKMNQIEMDTFSVRVDMGSLLVEKCNYSRAKNLYAEVGFGKLWLDFSDPAKNRGNVVINVGAGSLEVLIPEESSPIIIYLNESPLCHIKLDKSLRKLKPNVYVNDAYSPDAKNLTTFNVDVALGSISFTKL